METESIHITDGIENAGLSLRYIGIESAGDMFTTEKTAMLYIRYHKIHELSVE